MARILFLVRAAAAGLLALFFCVTPSQADIPDELYTALGLTRDSSPKELYEALTKRYYDRSANLTDATSPGAGCMNSTPPAGLRHGPRNMRG